MFIRQYFKDDENATKPRWVEVNVAGVRVENTRQFGGPWLALQLIRTLQLDTFLQKAIPEGREQVPWDVSSLILIIARLLEPSSELTIAEQWYPKTALADLLGVAEKQVDDNRLYRTLDALLPHKEDWHAIRDGLEVKIVPWPKDDDDDESGAESAAAITNASGAEGVFEQEPTPETFILCRRRRTVRRFLNGQKWMALVTGPR